MNNHSNLPKEYMTVREVAEYTGYTVATVLRQMKAGKIQGHYPYGRRPVLFLKSDIDSFYNGRETETVLS